MSNIVTPTKERKAIHRINQVVNRRKQMKENGKLIFLIVVDLDSDEWQMIAPPPQMERLGSE